MTDRIEMRLRGRMIEKFVGRAIGEGVQFQVVERTAAGEMKLIASEKNAQRLRQMAEQYRMDLTVVGEVGRPIWKRRFRERATLAAGLALGVILLTAFTGRIWRVEAVSLDDAADAHLLRAIEQSAAEWGARPGVLRASIDRDALASDIQMRWPELTHVSVRSSGVYLRVEVAVEETAPDVYDVSAGRDLVAARDAVIVHVEPLAGKANIKPGDTVRQGQVLILGEERIDTDQTRGIRALGQVIGKVWFDAECSLPTAETVRTRTGSRRVSAELRLGDWSVSLAAAEDYPSQEIEEEALPVGGLYLPVRIVRTTRWETEEKSVFSDRDRLLDQGREWALELARARLPAGAEETGSWVDFSESGGIITAQATIEAQMNIAVDRAQLLSGLNE